MGQMVRTDSNRRSPSQKRVGLCGGTGSAAEAIRAVSKAGDRGFESRSLQRRVRQNPCASVWRNQRLYRIARSILRDDGEAEDALQEAYCRAFARLDTFRDSRVSPSSAPR
jgi:Sigma-70 region 2